MDVRETLKTDSFFHIYNNTKGDKKLFGSDEDYLQFLKILFEHISPIANIYSYCLMPQHFHLLVKIKPEKEIFTYFKIEGRFPDETMTLEEVKALSASTGLENLDILGVHINKQFINFFASYTKSYHQQHQSKGELFDTQFNRVRILDNAQLRECLSYIHSNPIKHKLAKDITAWKYNSYNAMLSDRPTKLMRNEVIDIFESVENFKEFHNEKLMKYA